MLFSHIKNNDDSHIQWRYQSTDEHNVGVARFSSAFAKSFGFDSIGYIMGLLHDKGKEQGEWQKYIQGMVKNGPHHAYVGAFIAQKQYPQIAPFIAKPIARLYNLCEYV